MKMNLSHLMPHRIQRFHSNGQFHKTGTYGGSAVAKSLSTTIPCVCSIPGGPSCAGYMYCCSYYYLNSDCPWGPAPP
jgi:hypothetical protein